MNCQLIRKTKLIQIHVIITFRLNILHFRYSCTQQQKPYINGKILSINIDVHLYAGSREVCISCFPYLVRPVPIPFLSFFRLDLCAFSVAKNCTMLWNLFPVSLGSCPIRYPVSHPLFSTPILQTSNPHYSWVLTPPPPPSTFSVTAVQ